MNAGLFSAVVALGLLVASPRLRADSSTRANAGVEEHLGASLRLNVAFQDTTRARVLLSDLVANGRPTLLVLAYNRCPKLCSLVLRGVADAVRKLDSQPGEAFNLVTLSIDPGETADEAARTQAVVLERAGYSAQRQRWRFLVGTKPAIDRVARTLGFRYSWDERSQQFAHPAVLFVLSKEGAVKEYLYGLRPEPSQLTRALFGGSQAQTALARAGALECFRLEMASRKYGGVIERSFQAGSGLLLLAVALGLSRLAWRGGRRE
jgi:protein SCO1/2